MRALLLAATACVVALLGIGPATASTTHQPRATFGAGPASAKGIDGRPYFSYQSTPGGRITDHLGIVNLTHHAEVVAVYTVDATSTSTGGFVYASQAAPRNGAGGWVAVGSPHASSRLRLAPRSSTVVPLRISLPATATPGDHAAGVVVSLTSTAVQKNGEKVSLDQRVATRMLFRVSGPLRPRLSVESLHVAYHPSVDPIGGGRATVTYLVRNTGNVILGGHQQLVVRGLLGGTGHVGPLATIPAILPGGVVPVTFTATGIRPELRMSATVTLTPLGVTGDVDPGLHPTSATVHFWALPWALLVVLALLALAVVLVRRHRGRPQPDGTTDPSPITAAERETVQ